MSYGIANRGGQVAHAEAARIVAHAREHGMDTLDTAAAYGDSEQILGEIGVSSWRVVSKLAALGPGAEIARWVEECVRASLARLRVDSLYGMLVHRCADLAGPRGAALFESLQRLKALGLIERVGVSVYGPEDLDRVARRFPLDIVQAPFSVFDRRLQSSGWLRELKSAGVEIHTRSAFLQGLLLLTSARRPARFAPWAELWSAWEQWVRGHGDDPAGVCLGFVLGHPEIDRVVVGVDDDRQLTALIRAAASLPAEPPPPALSCSDLQLIDPSSWGSH
jgi:aryl-alcohol dehydrogenase-like predicted oxidoreductase